MLQCATVTDGTFCIHFLHSFYTSKHTLCESETIWHNLFKSIQQFIGMIYLWWYGLDGGARRRRDDGWRRAATPDVGRAAAILGLIGLGRAVLGHFTAQPTPETQTDSIGQVRHGPMMGYKRPSHYMVG